MGQHTVLTCKALDTRPAAEFEWYIDGVKQTIGVGPPSEVPPEGNIELVDTAGTLTFVPGRENHDQVVKCRVSIPTEESPIVERNVQLKVLGNIHSLSFLP